MNIIRRICVAASFAFAVSAAAGFTVATASAQGGDPWVDSRPPIAAAPVQLS